MRYRCVHITCLVTGYDYPHYNYVITGRYRWCHQLELVSGFQLPKSVCWLQLKRGRTRHAGDIKISVDRAADCLLKQLGLKVMCCGICGNSDDVIFYSFLNVAAVSCFESLVTRILAQGVTLQALFAVLGVKIWTNIRCSRNVLVCLFNRFAPISYGQFIAIRYKFKRSTYNQEPLVIGRRGVVQREI
jgi:hypothetical protein